MFLYSCAEMGIASWISSYFVNELKSSRFMGTVALSSYWSAQLIGRSTIGLNVDRIKNEVLISFMFLISTPFLLGAALTRVTLHSWILFTITGFTMAPLWPTILSDARGHFTDYPGTAFGIIAASGASAGIVVPPLIGRIADIYSISTGILITPAAMLIGGGIYLYLLIIKHNNKSTQRREMR